MATDLTKPLDCYRIDVLEHESMTKDCSDNIAKRVTDECNKAILEQILVELGGSTPGVPYHLNDVGVTDVIGVPKDILTSTVPAATTKSIANVFVSTRAAGRFEITIDGTKVGSGRTGNSNMNVQFEFSPAISVATGLEVKVSFTLLRGQVGQDVEVYMMGTDTV